MVSFDSRELALSAREEVYMTLSSYSSLIPSLNTYIPVLTLLYVRLRSTEYVVSSCYYMCVLVICVSSYYDILFSPCSYVFCFAQNVAVRERAVAENEANLDKASTTLEHTHALLDTRRMLTAFLDTQIEKATTT